MFTQNPGVGTACHGARRSRDRHGGSGRRAMPPKGGRYRLIGNCDRPVLAVVHDGAEQCLAKHVCRPPFSWTWLALGVVMSRYVRPPSTYSDAGQRSHEEVSRTARTGTTTGSSATTVRGAVGAIVGRGSAGGVLGGQLSATQSDCWHALPMRRRHSVVICCLAGPGRVRPELSRGHTTQSQPSAENGVRP